MSSSFSPLGDGARRVRALHRIAAQFAETAPRPTFASSLIITGADRGFDPMTAIEAAPRGAAILIRDYDRADRRAFAAGVADAARRAGLHVLVARDARLAADIGACGVHLPEALSSQAPPLKRRGLIVSIAAHSPAALRRAAAMGADAALLSPVFVTQSHPEAEGLGVLRAAACAARTGAPVFALGGIDHRYARRLIGTGFAGVAAISGFHPH
ncbi:MAG: thiamine phosphate synthase [Pseudomonadota bacterium]